jgi:hypothetical protein
LAQDFPVRVEEAAAGELVSLIVTFGKGSSGGVVKSDGAIEFSVLELSGGGEGAVGIVALVATIFLPARYGVIERGDPSG